MTQPLVVIPTYLRTSGDVEVLELMLGSLRRYEPEADVLVVDDGSPVDELPAVLDRVISRFQVRVHAKEENQGFSRTVNVGMREALSDQRDVILANADLEFRVPFVETMAKQQRLDGAGDAEVVGALLVYPAPRGLIQHGGIYFSILTRTFGHMYQLAPEDLPEALEPAVRPVTGALQLIRWAALASVGVYDEAFRLGWEDVDYNVRVLREGGQCVYQPLVRAWHGESVFRGQANKRINNWTAGSWGYFRRKWQDENFMQWVPTL